MSKNYIPLATPTLKGNELKYVKECIDTEWISSAGKFVETFEHKIAKYTGSSFAVACVNGTSALQVSLRLAGVDYGDEVIVPTLTFIAPVNAIRYNGAAPIFMDTDNYYNIDAEKTIDFIKKQTNFKNGFTYNKLTNKKISAIIPVHVWGNAVDLEELSLLCSERKIAIVEDSSESLGTVYTRGSLAGRHAGTIGSLGCLSFNGNKIITAGGGGAILTNNYKVARKAKYLTTQAKDDPVYYIHNEIGYNFRLTNIQAAIGVAQLEKLDEILTCKKKINSKYDKLISEIEGLSLAPVPDYSNNNHWLNLLQIEKNSYGLNRDDLMLKLEKNNIQTRPVWGLNHFQKPFAHFQNYKIENAQKLLKKSLCIPSSVNLNDDDINYIKKRLIEK